MAKSLAPTLIMFSLVLLVAGVSSTSIDTFVYGGCSQLRYTPGSPYESTLNSLLTSLVNSASFSLYNNFTSSSTQYSSPTIYSLYQCRGDLPPADCSRCVARAVTQLGTLCASSCGGALQLDGCLIKYDNVTFLGVEDKTVLFRKCGPYEYDSSSSTSTLLARRNAVLDYVAAAGGGGGDGYRVGGSGEIHAVAQCVQDLSRSECQDCVSEAIGELKSACGASAWGDMFLGKCYARFSEGGAHSRGGGGGQGTSNNNDEEIEKTLAILIGLIAGVALLIVFLSFLRKLCERGKGGK